MKAVIQRVQYATVKVDGTLVGQCGHGFMILLGVENNDTMKDLDVLVNKIVKLRVFEDEAGKMNLSIKDVGGEILVISQFTLYADCRKGNRPSFINAAPPAISKPLYEKFVEAVASFDIHVEHGEFGAEMKVELLNDGPVTVVLESKELLNGKER